MNVALAHKTRLQEEEVHRQTALIDREAWVSEMDCEELEMAQRIEVWYDDVVEEHLSPGKDR